MAKACAYLCRQCCFIDGFGEFGEFLNDINPRPSLAASYSDTIHFACQHTTNPATFSDHVFCIFLSCDVTVELEDLKRCY